MGTHRIVTGHPDAVSGQRNVTGAGEGGLQPLSLPREQVPSRGLLNVSWSALSPLHAPLFFLL